MTVTIYNKWVVYQLEEWQILIQTLIMQGLLYLATDIAHVPNTLRRTLLKKFFIQFGCF